MQDARAVLQSLGAPLAALSTNSGELPRRCGFLAYPGEAGDGRERIAAAIAAGAAAVLWERRNFAWSPAWRAPNCGVVGLKNLVGELAHHVYGKPSQKLRVFAITGTNGKTTISHFLARLCDSGGKAAGVIGTLGAGRLSRLTPLANTTPGGATLHALLRRFARARLQCAAVEASSHGIAQGRLGGVCLAAAALANVGRDHLDYHGGLANYRASKAALFNAPGLPAAVVNADDPYCAQLARRLRSRRGLSVLTYGKAGADFRLLAATPAPAGGARVKVDGVFGARVFALPFAAAHNISNFCAAALLAHVAGVSASAVAAASPRLRPPRGRMQQVAKRPAVYVDYAHTPDALAAALLAARPPAGRLLLVFGCGGNRDAGKRAQMGRLAARHADAVFVTDDNPRQESAAAIRAAVCAAAPGARNIGGRARAIAAALRAAGKQDAVLIAGKGHEQTQEAGGQTRRFSDAQTARAWLQKNKGAA